MEQHALAKYLYRAYTHATKKPPLEWEVLSPVEQDGWIFAARASVTFITTRAAEAHARELEAKWSTNDFL